MDSEIQLEIAYGAQALHNLSRYGNAHVAFSRCFCEPGCTNTRLILWRLPHPSDPDSSPEDPPQVVTFGIGATVWGAAADCYEKLLVLLKEHNQREDEIASLEKLWSES